jgi:hypothetical protein
VFQGDSFALRLGGEARYVKLSYGESIATDASGQYVITFESFEKYVSFSAAADLQFGGYFHAQIGGTRKSLDLNYGPILFTSGQPSYAADGAVYDFGFLFTYSRPDSNGWSFSPALGASLRNRGDDIEFPGGQTVDPGRYAAYGVSLLIQGPHTGVLNTPVPVFSAVVNFDFEKEVPVGLRSDNIYTAGLEMGFRQIVFARLGFQSTENVDPKVLTLGAGAGLPLHSFLIRFDYALVPLDIVNVPHGDLTRANKFALMVAWIPRG